jgi:hypothetical protein
MDLTRREEAIIIDNDVMIKITAMAEANAQFWVTLIWVYIMTEMNLFPQSPPTRRGIMKAAMAAV